MIKNKYTISIIIILTFIIISSIIGLTNGLDWGGDDAQIIAQTIAILNNTISQHFDNYAFIIDNSIDPIGTKAYSWGVPIFFSFMLKLFPTDLYTTENINYFYLKLPIVFCFAGIIFLLFKELKKRVTFATTIIFTSLFALSPYLINFTNEIMKDFPFAFFTFLSVITFNKLCFEQRTKNKIILSILSTLLIIFCLTIRENGSIILLLFIFCYFLNIYLDIKNKTQKWEINSLIYINVILFSSILFLFISKFYPVDYVKGLFSYNFETIFYNFKYYINEFRICFFNFKIYDSICLFTFFSLLIYGFKKDYKKEIINSFFLLLICTNFIFSANQGIRYILPFLPFIFLYAAVGVEHISNKKIKFSLLFLFVLAILTNIKNIYEINKYKIVNNHEFGVVTTESKDVYEYIKKNTKKTDIFIYCKPRVLHLFTNRQSFQISSKIELLNKANYQLTVIGENTPGSFYQKEMFNFEEKTYIKTANVFLTPIYKNSNYILYKIEKNTND